VDFRDYSQGTAGIYSKCVSYSGWYLVFDLRAAGLVALFKLEINVFEEQKKQFADAARMAGQLGLLSFSSGNLSWRVSGEAVLLTASRSWLGELSDEQVTVSRISDGTVIEGPAATIESKFHLGILNARADANVVLHFQSPFATALCCHKNRQLNFNITPEIPSYIGEIGWVDFFIPGSDKLAEAVIEVMKNHNMAMLLNHGQVTVGKDLKDAIQRAGFFEMTCRTIILNGDNVRVLPGWAVEQLRACAKV